MLVLSRKETQRIRVGEEIVVTVVKIAGDKVRVGIEAPSDVLVLRDELETWEARDAGGQAPGRNEPAHAGASGGFYSPAQPLATMSPCESTALPKSA